MAVTKEPESDLKTENTPMSGKQALGIMDSLIAEHGRKIILDEKDTPDFTPEQRAAQILYKAIYKQMSHNNPEFQEAEKVKKTYAKYEVNSVFGLVGKFIIKFFWIVLAILIFLALLKFVLS